MKSCNLVAKMTALACVIANNATKEEIGLLLTMLGQLTASLSTILVEQGIQERIESSKEQQNSETSEEIDEGVLLEEPLLDEAILRGTLGPGPAGGGTLLTPPGSVIR